VDQAIFATASSEAMPRVDTCSRGAVEFYAVLGVPTTADPGEIRTAYRQAALRSHPDKGGSASDFRLVVQAFAVLGNPQTRTLYDDDFRARGAPQAKGKKRKTGEPCETNCADEKLSGQRKCGPGPSAQARSSEPEVPVGGHRKGVKAPRKQSSEVRRRCHLELQAALEALRSAASAMKLEQRRSCLGCLSGQIKAALVRHMEDKASQAKEVVTPASRRKRMIPLVNVAEERSDDEALHAAGLPLEEDALLALEDGSCLESVGVAEEFIGRAASFDGEGAEETGPQTPSRSRGRSGICGVFSYHDGYYAAGICLPGLRIETRRTRSLETAIWNQALLMQIRQATTYAMRNGSTFDDAIRAAIPQVFAETEASAQQLGLSFHAFVDMRKTIGTKIHGRRRTSLEHSLVSRARLHHAGRLGWEAVRAEWVRCMMAPCADQVKHRKGLSREKAEAVADAAWDRYAERRESIKPRRSKPADEAEAQARRLEKEQRRLRSGTWRAVLLERRFHRAAAAVGRALARMQGRMLREQRSRESTARRAAQQALRARIKERRCRKQWYQRPDITMEEIMRGYPGS